MQALGRLFDVVVGSVPSDAVNAEIVGNRVHLKNCGGVTILVCAAAGSTDIVDVDLQQHTAASGGNSIDLDVITNFNYKSETTLDGDEVWTRATQSAASEITNVGAASEQLLLAIDVDATQLSDGYEWISLTIPDLGTNGTRYCCIIYILRDLVVQRAPQTLVQPQA